MFKFAIELRFHGCFKGYALLYDVEIALVLLSGSVWTPARNKIPKPSDLDLLEPALQCFLPLVLHWLRSSFWMPASHWLDSVTPTVWYEAGFWFF